MYTVKLSARAALEGFARMSDERLRASVDAAASGPLVGITVVEFAHTIMGPSCGMLLADLGATVIKVEPPGGDTTRRLIGIGAGFFSFFNRNKASVAVDLKSDAGKTLAFALLREADVAIENFGPGTMERLGLGYAEVAALNPRLVYCALKGFLPGPYEERVALDEVVQMMGGLAYMTGPPGRPLRAGASVIDIMGGTLGALGIVAALRERESTGRGQLVQSALFESVVFLMGQHMAQAAVQNAPVDPMPARVSAWAVYETFTSRDGRQLFLGITTDRIWERFCAEFERPDLAADPRLKTNNDRIRERGWMLGEIERIIGALDAVDVLRRCERAKIACAPIGRPEELADDPHLHATGGLLDTELPDGRTTPLPALPLAMDGRLFGLRMQPPQSGEHTAAVLRALGYDDEQIAALERAGTVEIASS